MKLSDAILAGCETVTEQAFGQSWERDGTRCLPAEATHACALGAAHIGGYEESIADLFVLVAACPACKDFDAVAAHTGTAVREIVAHLNDDHRWSREQIAAWLKEQGL